MDIELLVVPDCPNQGPAATLLRRALDDVGLTGVSVVATVIDTKAAAERRRFSGSPTILINGVDPFSASDQAPALACRVYSHPTGPTGLPELSALRQALKRAADTGSRTESRR